MPCQCQSACKAGGSGNEELKNCPPPSTAILWFVNVVKENPDREKKQKIFAIYVITSDDLGNRGNF